MFINLLIPILIILLFSCTSERNHENEKEKISETNRQSTNNNDKMTIYWAGLSGVYPQFMATNSEGHDQDQSQFLEKGMGYLEAYIRPIKANLTQKYGIKIIDEYMTPARLEYEFSRPSKIICAFPYIWKNPKQEFKNGVKFLYSVGLEFSGDKKSSILTLKKKKDLFNKHIDKLGNINIDSLLKDKSLIGNVIANAQIDDTVMERILYKDSLNTTQVKNEYKKNIKRLVASNNNQLLKMLAKNRFDYTFSDYITPAHYQQLNIKKDDYEEIQYNFKKINSFDDPELQTLSVRCSKHPLTFKAMKVFNQTIKKIRGTTFSSSMYSYRKKIEPNFNEPFAYDEIIGRLRSNIVSGEIDYWYGQYLNILKKDTVFIKNKIDINDNLTEIKNVIKQAKPRIRTKTYPNRNDNPLAIFAKNNNLVIVANKSILKNVRIVEHHWKYRGFYDQQIQGFSNFLANDDVQNILNNVTISFDQLTQSDFKINSLTMIVSGMNLSQFEYIIKTFRNLKSLKILFPQKKHINILQNYLSNFMTVEDLTIVKADLSLIPIDQYFSKLKSLVLTSTYIEEKVLSNIINRNSKTLNKLNLSDMHFKDRAYIINEFSKFSLPQLQYLDLFNLDLSAVELDIILKFLASYSAQTLEFLQLQGNFLWPRHYETIFNSFKKLNHIFADYGYISTQTKPITWTLPKKLQSLFISWRGMDNNTFKKIDFPQTLKTLQYTIKDKDNAKLLREKIPKSISSIILKGDAKYFVPLIKNEQSRLWLSNLKFLDLSDTRLTNHLFINIAKHLNKIEMLDLRNNLLTDRISSHFGSFKNIRSIQIGENFLTTNGVKNILTSPSRDQIQHLSIERLMSFDMNDISSILPKSLLSLNISNNSLGDNAFSILFENLPKSLQSLLLRGNEISSRNIAELSENFPKDLTTLMLPSHIYKFTEFVHFINSMPNSLQTLYLPNSNIQFDQESDLTFPDQLNFLYISRSKFDKNVANQIFTNLPHTLSHIEANGTQISARNFEKLIENPNLREIEIDLNEIVTVDKFRRRVVFLGSSPLENLIHYLTTNNCHLLGISPTNEKNISNPYLEKRYFQLIEQYKNRKISVHTFFLYGKFLDDSFAQFLSRLNLSAVRTFRLNNTNISRLGVEKILKALSKGTQNIRIEDSIIQSKDIDKILSLIPEEVQSLTLKNNFLGEKGDKTIRDWAKTVSKSRGIPLWVNH